MIEIFYEIQKYFTEINWHLEVIPKFYMVFMGNFSNGLVFIRNRFFRVYHGHEAHGYNRLFIHFSNFQFCHHP